MSKYLKPVDMTEIQHEISIDFDCEECGNRIGVSSRCDMDGDEPSGHWENLHPSDTLENCKCGDCSANYRLIYDIILYRSDVLSDERVLTSRLKAEEAKDAEIKRLREALKETLAAATACRNEMSDLVDLVGLIAEKHPKDVDEVFESDSGFVVYSATTPDFLSEEFDAAEEKAKAALEGGE
jgi:hypothetical protein